MLRYGGRRGEGGGNPRCLGTRGEGGRWQPQLGMGEGFFFNPFTGMLLHSNQF